MNMWEEEGLKFKTNVTSCMLNKIVNELNDPLYLTLNKLLMRFTLKSLSPALTTSPASSDGDPAPAMNSSDTQSVSILDALTITTLTTVDNKRVDKNVLEMNIFSVFFNGLLVSLLPLLKLALRVNFQCRNCYNGIWNLCRWV